jgi:hypothetical protein
MKRENQTTKNVEKVMKKDPRENLSFKLRGKNGA